MSELEPDPLGDVHGATTSRDQRPTIEDNSPLLPLSQRLKTLQFDAGTTSFSELLAQHHASMCWGSDKQDLWYNEKHMGILYDKLPLVKKTLLESTNILCDNLKPDGILRSMKSKGALTQDDVTEIKKQTTATEQVDKLIDVLLRKPVSAYNIFMDTLQKERPDLHRQIKTIDERQSLKRKYDAEEKSINYQITADAVILLDEDIEDIANFMKPNELKRLFKELNITSADKEEAIKENIDPKDEARLVLTYWRQINGSKATREKIIVALKANKLTQYAAVKLEQRWNVKYHTMENEGKVDSGASTSHNHDSPECQKPKCSHA